MGNKKEIEMGVLDQWSSQIFSGKRFSGEGKAFNKAGIGSDCRSDPIRTGMFAFGAEELF